MIGQIIRNSKMWLFPSPKDMIIRQIIDYIRFEHLQGDYLEFGTYKGHSLITAMKYAKKKDIELRFIAFDSFSGLPEVKAKYKTITEHKFKTSYEEVKADIKKYETDKIKAEVVKGFYQEVCNKALIEKLKIDKVAVVYIDCDLYESTKTVLEFITPFIQSGTVIVFDEYFGFLSDYKFSELRAVDEWEKKYHNIRLVEFSKYGRQHNSFIVLK